MNNAGRGLKLTSLLRIVGALAGLSLLLAALLFASTAISTFAPVAKPAAQGPKPANSRFGSTSQNNASAYMESYGYKVDAVGLPAKADGTPDEDSAVILMPAQSPQFDPDKRAFNDPGTVKQVTQGFVACRLAFPKATKIAVGLQWGESIIMYTAQSASVQALQAGELTTADLWSQVAPSISVIDAATWQPLSQTNFISKDFSGHRNLAIGLPPNTERPGKQQGQIRLQTSTAYLATGSKATLIATASDQAGKPATGATLDFTSAQLGQDPQLITSSPTGNDGSARASLQANPQAPGQLTIQAVISNTTSSIATVPMLVGPPVTGTQAIDVLIESLHLQGFDVLNVLPAEQSPAGTPGGTNVKQVSIVAEIAASRLDLRVRNQILSMAGTAFALYGGAETVYPTLLYRSQGRAYELIFRVARGEWESWINGTVSESYLWEHISLDTIIDAETKQAVAQRDFINKNFGTISPSIEISAAKSIESKLVLESWGEQLYSGKLVVPVGAVADNFEVANRGGQAEFAIFASTDPTKPLYRSSQDTDGSNLKRLSLGTGQYTFSIEGNTAPALVRLAYIERVGGGNLEP